MLHVKRWLHMWDVCRRDILISFLSYCILWKRKMQTWIIPTRDFRNLGKVGEGTFWKPTYFNAKIHQQTMDNRLCLWLRVITLLHVCHTSTKIRSPPLSITPSRSVHSSEEEIASDATNEAWASIKTLCHRGQVTPESLSGEDPTVWLIHTAGILPSDEEDAPPAQLPSSPSPRSESAQV